MLSEQREAQPHVNLRTTRRGQYMDVMRLFEFWFVMCRFLGRFLGSLQNSSNSRKLVVAPYGVFENYRSQREALFMTRRFAPRHRSSSLRTGGIRWGSYRPLRTCRAWCRCCSTSPRHPSSSCCSRLRPPPWSSSMRGCWPSWMRRRRCRAGSSWRSSQSTCCC